MNKIIVKNNYTLYLNRQWWKDFSVGKLDCALYTRC
jgi:hypothetical protein